jgi:hypothetical protein
MPPLTGEPLTWKGYLVLAGLAALGVTLIVFVEACLVLTLAAAIGGFALVVLAGPFYICAYVCDRRYVAALVAERQGEDIGTFARFFDRHSKNFDTWVIRATWDALMFYVSYPVRATDRIDDLGIDPDDIFFSIIPEIIERSGHVLDGKQPDTHPARETVGDLVLWVSSLKRSENARTA